MSYYGYTQEYSTLGNQKRELDTPPPRPRQSYCGCELSDVGSGSLTWVLYKSSTLLFPEPSL